MYNGDIVEVDSDGLHYIVGRKKDMIKVAGEIVFSAEVEEKIHRYSKVKEAAVIGVADNLRGEVPKAFIVPKEEEALEEQELTSNYDDLKFEERLGLLVDREILERENRRLDSRLRKARLGGATMADIDYRANRGLDKTLLKSLESPEWLKEHMNILITGPTGIGKSFIGKALGHQGCLMGYSALAVRLPRLFEELAVAQGDGSIIKIFDSLNRIDILIMDDFGLDIFNNQQRRFFLEILEDRYEKRSTIITSQTPIKHWHQIIEHATLADAILDRIIHNSYQIELKGESMRKIKAKKNKK